MDVNDTYTCSIWKTAPGGEDAFLGGFLKVTEAADALGGAREGMILRDDDDPTRFLVIRRWDSPQVLARWGQSAEARAAAEAMEGIGAECTHFYAGTSLLAFGS